MKRFLPFLLICLLICFSCKNEDEKRLDEMGKIWKEYIDNKAFRNNQTIEYVVYNPIQYTTKNENYLDSLRLLENLDKIDFYKPLIEKQLERMRSTSQEYRIYGDAFGRNDNLAVIAKENFDEETKKYRNYMDSFNYYIRKDSLIQQNILKRVNPKVIYVLEVYVKATAKDNNTGHSENVADTMYCCFDKDLNLILQ